MNRSIIGKLIFTNCFHPGPLHIRYGCVAWSLHGTPNSGSGAVSDPVDCFWDRSSYWVVLSILEMRYVPNLIIGCYAMFGDNLCSFLKGNGEVDLGDRGGGWGEIREMEGGETSVRMY